MCCSALQTRSIMAFALTGAVPIPRLSGATIISAERQTIDLVGPTGYVFLLPQPPLLGWPILVCLFVCCYKLKTRNPYFASRLGLYSLGPRSSSFFPFFLFNFFAIVLLSFFLEPEWRILECNNGGGGGIFPEVKSLVAKWIGTQKLPFSVFFAARVGF